MGSCKIASQPCDLGQVIGEGSAYGLFLSRSRKAINQGDFNIGQRELGRCGRRGAIDHGHPEQAPGQDAEYRDQVGQTFGGPEP